MLLHVFGKTVSTQLITDWKYHQSSPTVGSSWCADLHSSMVIADPRQRGLQIVLTTLRPQSNVPVVVLDVETTGIGATDWIVEIAIATLDPDTLEIVEEYDTLVNPLRNISGAVSDIHGLTGSNGI